jgi:hypothetical protein
MIIMAWQRKPIFVLGHAPVFLWHSDTTKKMYPRQGIGWHGFIGDSISEYTVIPTSTIVIMVSSPRTGTLTTFGFFHVVVVQSLNASIVFRLCPDKKTTTNTFFQSASRSLTCVRRTFRRCPCFHNSRSFSTLYSYSVKSCKPPNCVSLWYFHDMRQKCK